MLDFIIWLRWSYVDPTLWNLDLPHWPQAAGLFVLGVLAAERGWFANLDGQFARRCGWLTLAGLGALVALAGYTVLVGNLRATAGGWH